MIILDKKNIENFIVLCQALYGNKQETINTIIQKTYQDLKQNEKYTNKDTLYPLVTLLKILLRYKQEDIYIQILHNEMDILKKRQDVLATLLFHTLECDNTKALQAIIDNIKTHLSAFEKNLIIDYVIKIFTERHQQKIAPLNCQQKNIALLKDFANETTTTLNKSAFEYITDEKFIRIATPVINEKYSKEELYGNGICQQEYTEYGEIISTAVAKALKNKTFSIEIIDSPLLSFYKLGLWRRHIARRSAPQSADFATFGLPRKDELYTPMSGQYSQFRKEFFINILPTEHTRINISHFFVHDDGQISIDCAFHTFINNKLIPTTALHPNYLTNENKWDHTDSRFIPELSNHIQTLINNITSLPEDISNPEIQKSLITKVAKIHWYLAHTTPFLRGSAAIAEWIIKGILKFHGLATKWSTMPDCKALIQPNIDRYAAEYHEFTRLWKIHLPTYNEEKVYACINALDFNRVTRFFLYKSTQHDLLLWALDQGDMRYFHYLLKHTITDDEDELLVDPKDIRASQSHQEVNKIKNRSFHTELKMFFFSKQKKPSKEQHCKNIAELLLSAGKKW